MSNSLNPEKALIFRITHAGNVEAVLTFGCLCKSSQVSNSGYVEIGNQELILKRSHREVPCPPGGTLSDYVPFYFTPYTPMMYNIKTGYGVPKQDLRDIVILVSSLYKLVKDGVPFVFTDRHAYLRAAQFSNDLADLSWIIWKSLQARDFKKDDVDKFEKYQAEALVYRHVPIGSLHGIVCYNDSVAAEMQALASRHERNVKIVVQPKWYL